MARAAACEISPRRRFAPLRFRGGLVFKAHRLLYHSTLSVLTREREGEGGKERNRERTRERERETQREREREIEREPERKRERERRTPGQRREGRPSRQPRAARCLTRAPRPRPAPRPPPWSTVESHIFTRQRSGEGRGVSGSDVRVSGICFGNMLPSGIQRAEGVGGGARGQGVSGREERVHQRRAPRRLLHSKDSGISAFKAHRLLYLRLIDFCITQR